ncbi:MAG: Lrp/AsnC family transcriptional regulator [Steroidobacteraceae bacterium]
MTLDGTDLRILGLVQNDASQSLAEIAEQVHLSPNACWRRIRQLEEGGIIVKRVALLDPAKLGLGVTVFVMVRAAEHSEEWFRNFAATVASLPEVVEFYRTSGEIDYLLKLQLANVAGYDEVYKGLIHSAKCADISAVFCMEQIKHTTALPLTGRR